MSQKKKYCVVNVLSEKNFLLHKMPEYPSNISLVTRRGTLLMETRLLHDYFGNFSKQGEKYYFGNSEKFKFHFWVEGTFGDDI